VTFVEDSIFVFPTGVPSSRRPVVGNLTSRFVIESASYSVNLLINPGYTV
jgi:hypothetical protein